MKATIEKIDFFIIRLINPKPIYERIIKKPGFKICGENVELEFKYKGKNKSLQDKGGIRLIGGRDIKAATSIAKDAFRLSYLYRTGFGSIKDIDRYHIKWLKNLISDKNSYVFVAEDNKRVIGFNAVTLDKVKRNARIVLIAVHNRFRGRGIGAQLVKHCLDFIRPQVKKVYVKTQADNKNAISLYRRQGFKILRNEKIYCQRIKAL
jgi:ribosomal protein S18 acetylase RimI-like enzyme